MVMTCRASCMILRVDETTKVKPSLIRKEEMTSMSLLSLLVRKDQELGLVE
jgi:hypothetical protein